MSNDDLHKAVDNESRAVERLRKDNSPENRKAFQDAHRKVVDVEIEKTRRRLHDHYRDRARQADSPQVDLESPADYNKKFGG